MENPHTANKDDMFNLIREALDKVFKKYSRGEPDSNLFFQNFGSHMKSHPQYLDPLTGNRLIQTLSDVKPSSTVLDGWSLLGCWFLLAALIDTYNYGCKPHTTMDISPLCSG